MDLWWSIADDAARRLSPPFRTRSAVDLSLVRHFFTRQAGAATAAARIAFYTSAWVEFTAIAATCPPPRR